MTLEIPHPPLKGKKALVVGIANDQSIAYGCAKAFHELGADLAVTYLNEKSRTFVEPLASGLKAPIFMPLDVAAAGRARSGVREDRKEMGQARHPGALDRVRAEGRPAGRLARLLGRGIQGRDGYFLSLVRAHGEACRAADEGRRHDVRDELLRRAKGRAQLQRDGTGQGGARSELPLSRIRARPQKHPRARDFAGPAQDARCLAA